MRATQSHLVWAEIRRKALHVCGVIIPVLYLIFPKYWILLGFLIGFCILVLLEWLRFRGRITLPALREREHRTIPAYVFFVIGAFLSILIFEKGIAISAILMLALGDTTSALTRVLIDSEPRWQEGRRKRLEVLLVMFVTCFVIGWLMRFSIPVAAVGALGATVADGVPLRLRGYYLDDNLTIPLFAGALMTVGAMW
ncbi:MAG: diacylglycerol/polyprenol kinase family protein [Candidatus Methanospirareceae archaeon]